MRYVGVKNNKIKLVSEDKIKAEDLTIIEVPAELENINSNDLIFSYKIRDGKFKCKHGSKSAKDLKVAFVGNWKMKCGISTYSENLWAEVSKYLGDYKLFIENNPNPTSNIYQIGNVILPNDKVVSCWNRGESLKELVDQIKAYDPDIVWIQHEFGLWSNACHWLSMINQLSDYRIIVTMHSVFHHKDKTIVEAAIPEIVVHLQGAYDVLKKEKQVPGNVYVIPHGCYSSNENGKLWNFYKTEHTIIQAGFLFKYKGWEEALKAISILKTKYPDVFFTGLCSESPYCKYDHQLYYEELMDLINKLDISENVSLIRGYQSDQTFDSYFRTNRIALFPYVSVPEHEVFGASGAARLAMSKGLPVITSSANHFSDLPTIKADSPEQISIEIDKLFSDWKLINKQIDVQNKYIADNSWENVAKQYIKLFEN